MSERIRPGYRTASKPGVSRSHVGDLFCQIVPGDRVQLTYATYVLHGVIVGRDGDYYEVDVDGRGRERHHYAHVSFDPSPDELQRRMRVIRSGWSDTESAKRAPHAVMPFRWQVAEDLTTGSF